MSTQARALQFLDERRGEATKKQIAETARKHDPGDVLSDPKNVGKTMWRLHKSGLVDFEDKDGRGGGKERLWKKRETRT